MDDPLLRKKNKEERVDLYTAEDPITVGQKESGITDLEIEEVVNFVHSLYIIKARGRKNTDIANDVNRHIHGALYALGTGSRNPEYIEHAASSLREMLHMWSGWEQMRDTICIQIGKSSNEDHKIRNQCERIWNFYGLFSALAHHNLDGVVGKYRAINREMYKVSNEECFMRAKNHEIFCMLVGEYVKEMYNLSKLVTDHGSN